MNNGSSPPGLETEKPLVGAKWNWWFRANEKPFPPYFKEPLKAAERRPDSVRLKS